MSLGNWLNNKENNSGIAVEYKRGHTWHQITWHEYLNKIVLAGEVLLKNGFNPKQHVGIMSSTRWEWAALDMAILGLRGVTVPMYPNLSDDDLIFIINQSEIKILVVEDEKEYEQVLKVRKKLEHNPILIRFIDIDFDQNVEDVQRNYYLQSCLKIKPKDIATIVYTSGTTGQPKGAVLLHEAIISEVTESFDLFDVKPNFKSLTFLPYAHVLGRIEHWGSCYKGHTLAYAESIEKIKSNLLEVKPDFLIAVPRIFEKVYSGIMAEVETNAIKQKLFSSALAAAKEVQLLRRTKQTIPWGLLLKYEALSKLVFSPIHKAFGGKLLFAVSGGAPLSPQLAEFFSSCGINILEGYGLTETCAAIAVNQPSNNQPGTVGKPIGDVQIKFAADGEILVKSKKCLVEYYKNLEATKASIQDGFFLTGDIGELTDRGFLKITDRKKDLIKTAGGKYVAPQKLEGLVKQDPIISQVLIHGDQKKFVSALISIDELPLKNWADSQQITYSHVADLYQHPALKVRLQKHIQSVNSTLASFESIKKFEIISEPWTVENGSLTQSLKVKRKFLEGKYADTIKEIYD
ncbi:MAG: long-chain fatty acid--CoA ligase [Bdellovibrio sp.]|nr:long-chain fatty acid--CoA ligase [Bdellovibrio sp.]